MVNESWADELDTAATKAVRELLEAARDADGRPELPADGSLPGEFGGGAHLLATAGDDLVGYAHLNTGGDAFGRQVAELVVRPDRRRQGVATSMVHALVVRAGAGEPGDRLRVWSHGDHPGAARLAGHAGFTRARELLVMRVDGIATADWPEPSPPPGITLRTFVPGQDEQALVDVNARAFSWHPEQGRLSVDDVLAAERESWFDPAGFFLAENAEGQVVGFHWTKVHPANPARFDGRPAGEVYVVGVDPGAQGGGLGRALTLAGLRYLRDPDGHSLGQVILYVEGDNAPAVAVYRRLGFTTYETDVQYAR